MVWSHAWSYGASSEFHCRIDALLRRGGTDVFGLAGFLRDDDLIGHNRLVSKDRFDNADGEHIANEFISQAAQF